MIKLFEILYRRTDMTQDQAMAYWTTRHAPLIRQNNAASGLVHRYNNNVGVPLDWGPAGHGLLPFDGVMEAWLNIAIDDFAAAIARPGNPGIADELNFLSASPTMMHVEAQTVKPLAGSFQSKVLMFWRRGPEQTLAEADAIWRDRHVPAETAVWGDALVGFVANRGVPVRWRAWGEEMPPFDGVGEYYLDVPPGDLPSRWAEVASGLSEGTRAFAGDVRPMCVREVVQVGPGPGPGPD